MKTVTAKYVRQNFSEILNEVYFGRKKIIVTRSGKPLVVITSIKETKEGEKKILKKHWALPGLKLARKL